MSVYTYSIKNVQQLREFLSAVSQAETWPIELTVDDAPKAKKRTLSQNAALHLWCRQVAKHLNDAGLDMRAVMKPSAQIPWTTENVKNNLWRPMQIALCEKQSTAYASKKDYNTVYSVLSQHLITKLNVVDLPEWPKL